MNATKLVKKQMLRKFYFPYSSLLYNDAISGILLLTLPAYSFIFLIKVSF